MKVRLRLPEGTSDVMVPVVIPAGVLSTGTHWAMHMAREFKPFAFQMPSVFPSLVVGAAVALAAALFTIMVMCTINWFLITAEPAEEVFQITIGRLGPGRKIYPSDTSAERTEG